MEGVHERIITDPPVPVALTPVGVEGGAESIVTEVVAVVEALAFVAVRVYMVVEVGLTVVEALRVLVENEPGVIAMEEALETFQESTEEEPERISAGDALKEVMSGLELIAKAAPWEFHLPWTD